MALGCHWTLSQLHMNLLPGRGIWIQANDPLTFLYFAIFRLHLCKSGLPPYNCQPVVQLHACKSE